MRLNIELRQLEKRKEHRFYYIPYVMEQNYINMTCILYLDINATILDFREAFEKYFNIPQDSFVITSVLDNKFTRFFNILDLCRDFKDTILLYQIDPRLMTKHIVIREVFEKHNECNLEDLLDPDWHMVPLYSGINQVGCTKESIKINNIPKLFWANKYWSLEKLYQEVFAFYSQMLYHLNVYRRDLSEEEKETKALKFNLSFPELNEDNWKELLIRRYLKLATEGPFSMRGTKTTKA